MSQFKLKPELLLSAININLNTQLFTATRAYSKNLFNSLADGKRQAFMKLELGEDNEVVCELELDASEHVGSLNYGKFRKALAMMMTSIKQNIDTKTNINPMSSQTGELLFNIPGVLKTQDDCNVLVCSFKQIAPGLALVRLLYLDPDAFAKSAGINLQEIEVNEHLIELGAQAEA